MNYTREARDTARRAYSKNTTLRSADIGKAIGRSRQTVDSYIADLRAATQPGLDIKISRMDSLGIPQDRIAKRSGQVEKRYSAIQNVPISLFLCVTIIGYRLPWPFFE